MNEKFFDLSREKQDRMINGAIEVFAKNGYKHASTDDMVKAVDVSKGLWFHYFGSKAGLYRFVYGFSVKYVVLELASVLDSGETDYFEIVKQIEYTRMKVSKVYPYMTAFLDEALDETDEEIIEQTAEDRRIYTERMSSLAKNGDIEGILEKTTKDRIKKMLKYTIDGVNRTKGLNGAVEPETIYKEVRGYIELARQMASGMAETGRKVQETNENIMIDAVV